MVTVVEGDNGLEAWQQGVRAVLAAGGQDSNLITTIHQPCIVDLAWLKNCSPHSFSNKGENVKDVANTIFPDKLRQRAVGGGAGGGGGGARRGRARRGRGGRRAGGTY